MTAPHPAAPRTRWSRAAAVLIVAALAFTGLAVSPASAAPGTGDVNSFTFTGQWVTNQPGEKGAHEAGATATVQVDIGPGGGDIGITGFSNAWVGIATVQVDSATPGDVDMYRPNHDDFREWFTTPKLAEGRHTVKITVTGERNPESGWSWISVRNVRTSNGTVVTPTTTPPTTPPTQPPAASPDTATHEEFAYSGSWGSDAGEHWSNQANATATINAKIAAGGGTVSVKGWKGPGQGSVAVSADGGAETTANLNAGDWSEVSYWTSPNLPAGDHVIKVRIVGGGYGSVTGASTTNGVLSKPAGTPTTPPPTEPPPPTGGNPGPWLSGGAGAEIDGNDVDFGNWRGRPIEAMSTWADSRPEDCMNTWGIGEGGPIGSRNVSAIVAIGGKWGQSWSQAANGELDSTWRACLTSARDKWAPRDPSKLFISVFHEANGDWYEWGVSDGELGDFHRAFARFHTLQEEIIPDARLTFALNAETVGSSYSLADFTPDPALYDVLGVDFYSMHRHVDFDQFPALATADGKPFVVQEWGIKHDEGGGAEYIQYMHDNFQQHGGTGVGDMLIENYFNIGDYEIWPGGTSPSGRDRYAQLW